MSSAITCDISSLCPWLDDLGQCIACGRGWCLKCGNEATLRRGFCSKCTEDDWRRDSEPVFSRLTAEVKEEKFRALGADLLKARDWGDWATSRQLYPKYLRSTWWTEAVRPRELRRAGWRCEHPMGGAHCGSYLQVHHRLDTDSYARLGCELVGDCQVLCRLHHEMEHGR